MREQISEAIKDAINKQGIGINKLCRMSEISKNSLYKVLRCENYEISIVDKITKSLGITLSISSKMSSEKLADIVNDSK